MKEAQKSQLTLPTFLVKLLTILQDSQFQEIVCWTSTLDGFEILKLDQFVQKVLPKYFKHQNFSSFVRQLNMYGFTKIKGSQIQNIYHNPLFKKGNKSSLKKIERRLPIFDQKSQIKKKQKYIAVKKQQFECNNNLQQIKKNQMQLQQKIRKAFQNNNKAFIRNSKILNNLDQKQKEQYFIENIFQMIKQRSKINLQSELESMVGTQKSILSEFDKSKRQQSTLQSSGSSQQFCNIQQFLQLNEFLQLQQFGDALNFPAVETNQKNKL